MKVLLIQPPIEDFYCTSIRLYPLGLCSIAAAISDLCEVAILDAAEHHKPRKLSEHPFPELKNFYQPHLRSPLSLFSKYYRFGLTDEQIKKAIAEYRPTVVGISALFSAYMALSIHMAELVKKVNADIVTIVGGLHPTLSPESVLASPDVDYVIRGEGETPMATFIENLASSKKMILSDIPGLCYQENGNNKINPPSVETDINRLPSHRLLPPKSYLMYGKSYSFFLASRGCPYRCQFCGKAPFPYRQRTLGSIEEELHVHAQRGIEVLDFEDDMLTFDVRFFHDILAMLKKFEFNICAMNGLSPSHLNAQNLKLMLEAGFHKINVSVVELSSSILKSQSRCHYGSFFELLPCLEHESVTVEVHFIIGLPRQSVDHILDLILFLAQKKVLLGPSMFYPVPGSALWSDNEVPFKYCRSSIMYPAYFSRLTIITFMRLIRFINFCKNLVDKLHQNLLLSELLGSAHLFMTPEIYHIITHLCKQKRFLVWDKKDQDFREESCVLEIMDRFFQMLKHKVIRGYKTNHQLKVDL
ncbi:B12-binding domain-containing radical SAM protein [candidate division CSSED10-310 bacterium]|uniref:B12-binding domain-containing radical SAM protein n=1 Tax=candidate division CSSED10-310 bacterium TaxID=2855610 RepID=A0ABV6Z2L1_UNCC1